MNCNFKRGFKNPTQCELGVRVSILVVIFSLIKREGKRLKKRKSEKIKGYKQKEKNKKENERKLTIYKKRMN